MVLLRLKGLRLAQSFQIDNLSESSLEKKDQSMSCSQNNFQREDSELALAGTTARLQEKMENCVWYIICSLAVVLHAKDLNVTKTNGGGKRLPLCRKSEHNHRVTKVLITLSIPKFCH